MVHLAFIHYVSFHHVLQGGAAVLSYLTATPRYSGLKSLAGAIVSSPLIEQADNAKANALLIRAGSWIGAVLPSLQLNVGVASEVRGSENSLVAA